MDGVLEVAAVEGQLALDVRIQAGEGAAHGHETRLG